MSDVDLQQQWRRFIAGHRSTRLPYFDRGPNAILMALPVLGNGAASPLLCSID
jgi:hypothetical protein